MKKIFFFAFILTASVMSSQAASVATFENEEGGISTAAEAPYWYGIAPIQSGANAWGSGDYKFVTYNDDAWGPSYYYDFVVSNDKETAFTDYAHAYRSTQGGAYEGDNFAVWYNNFYGNAPIVAKEAGVIPGCFVCNCAYTANSMVNGDGFCKRYRKDSYFRIIFTGKLNDAETGSVKVALAENGTFIDKWTYVDLSSLGNVDEVAISYETSDAGTPTYFCLDNFGAEKPVAYEEPARAKFFLVADFENEEGGINLAKDTMWAGIAPLQSGKNEWKSGNFTFVSYNDDSWGPSYYFDVTVSNLQNKEYSPMNPYADQYSAAGKAAQGSNYAVWYTNYYGNSNIVLDEPKVLTGMAVTNTTWLVDVVLNGDGMSVEDAGTGLPFHAGDYYKLIVTGYKNKEAGESVEFYLADFRANQEGQKWYYAENWQWLDLSPLGEVDEIGFAVESTKKNSFGCTTPTYFCFDNLGGSASDCVLGEMTAMDYTTAIEHTEAAVNALKVVRDGQVIIIRDGKAFNVLGAEL